MNKLFRIFSKKHQRPKAAPVKNPPASEKIAVRPETVETAVCVLSHFQETSDCRVEKEDRRNDTARANETLPIPARKDNQAAKVIAPPVQGVSDDKKKNRQEVKTTITGQKDKENSESEKIENQSKGRKPSSNGPTEMKAKKKRKPKRKSQKEEPEEEKKDEVKASIPLSEAEEQALEVAACVTSLLKTVCKREKNERKNERKKEKMKLEQNNAPEALPVFDKVDSKIELKKENYCLVAKLNGFPRDVKPEAVESFVNQFFLSTCNTRFPLLESIPALNKNKQLGKKSFQVTFDNAQDLRGFYNFPLYNPFPDHTLSVVIKESKDTDDASTTRIEPFEGTQYRGNNVAILLEKPPRSVTEESLVDLIGSKFIRKDEQGNYGLRIRYNEWIVSAVIMTSLEHSKTIMAKHPGSKIYASLITRGREPSPPPPPPPQQNRRVVTIRGLPNQAGDVGFYEIMDHYCLHFLPDRFPITVIPCYHRHSYTSPGKLTFMNEKDAEDFCKYPHYNPFEHHALTLEYYDSNKTLQKVAVKPKKTNKNPKMSGAIVFFTNLPKEITTENLLNLVQDEIIQREVNGKPCITIFRGRQRISAKMLMAGQEDAESLVENCNGEILHPFKVPIQVSIC